MTPIDITKVKTTRDGRKVDIWKRLENGLIVGRIVMPDGSSSLHFWNEDGSVISYSKPVVSDLIEEPEVPCVNVYRGLDGRWYQSIHLSRKVADESAGGCRIACIPLTPELLKQYEVKS